MAAAGVRTSQCFRFIRLLNTALLTRGGVANSRPSLVTRSLFCTSHRPTQDGTNSQNTQQVKDTYTSRSEDQPIDEEQAPNETGSDESQHEQDIKHRILAAALHHVHQYGWTKKALEAGATDEGLPEVAHGMFPRGGADLVLYLYAKSNADLAQILAEWVQKAKDEGLEKPPTKPFIRDAVEARLRMVLPYLDKWPQAMAILALPQNAPEAWTNLMNLTDEIWYYAGDRSVDFNWYTKRMALAGVYKTTEIYMLQDKSPDNIDTWDFLDRRLGDLQKFGAAKKSCEESGDMLKEAVKGFSIIGRNILGINSRNR